MIKLICISVLTCFNFSARVGVVGEVKAGNTVQFYTMPVNGVAPFTHSWVGEGYAFSVDSPIVSIPEDVPGGVYEAIDTIRDSRGCVYIADYRFYLQDTVQPPIQPVITNTVTPH